MAAVKQFTVIFLFGISLPPCLSKVEYLYFSSPGNAEGAAEAGLYGGPVDADKNETYKEMYFSGFNCATLKGVNFYEVDIYSMSYDPISKHVLLDMDPGLTLVNGPLCRRVESCVNVTTMGLTPYFITAQGPQKMGPFAYYDSTIYYLLYGWTTLMGQSAKEGKLELRKFTDKDDKGNACSAKYPVKNSAVPVECTRLIATIAKEKYSRYVGFRQSNHLQVIKMPNGKLQFLTVIQRTTFRDEKYLDSYKMELLSIDEDGTIRSLHVEPIKDVFYQLAFYQIGGISFREGVLCWTTLTKLLCADWDHYKLTNIKTVLDDGQASAVCKGSERMTSNVTSGVAIARTHPYLEVYFGCIAKERGFGGAGLVRMGKKGLSGKPEIIPLINNGSKVLAGSMFMVDWCETPQYILDREAGVIDGANYIRMCNAWYLTISVLLLFIKM